MRVVTLGLLGLSWLVRGAEAAPLLEPCAAGSGCITVAVDGPPGVFERDDEVAVSVTFRAAADDGAEGGPDEIAAVGMSMAIPGLELADCEQADSNGLTAAFEPSPAVASGFSLFVENTLCLRRDHCLCPGAGQGRDDFVNLVVSGPRAVAGGGSTPVLPDGELLTIHLRVRQDSPGTIPLHIFSEADDPDLRPRPGGAAFITVGDRLAGDQTADRDAGTSRVRIIGDQILVAVGATVTVGPSPSVTVAPTPSVTNTTGPTASATATEPVPSATPTQTGAAATATGVGDTPTPSPPSSVDCPGDCGRDGVVTVDELITSVGIAIERIPLQRCPPADGDHSGSVGVAELVSGVSAALRGCPP